MKFIKSGELDEQTSVGISDQSTGERKPKEINMISNILMNY